MVFFNYSTMQMAAKVVYYGPGLCGKTTNLQYIYGHTTNDSRGEMVSLETETDRTLFFDLLPIDVGQIAGFTTRIQLYTVPGQVFYNTTRKLVLKGVDGMVFVADSQRPMLQANIDSFKNLEENLAEMGLALDTLPLVLQYNKRDLADILTVDELNQALNRNGWPFHESSAITGEGVFESLKSISRLTLVNLKKRLSKSGSRPSSKPVRPAPKARPPAPEPKKAPIKPPSPAPLAPPKAPLAKPSPMTAPQALPKAPPPVQTAKPESPKAKSVRPKAAKTSHATLDVLAELEKIRKQTIVASRPTVKPSSVIIPHQNGRSEINRDFQLTLKKDDFQRATRFLLNLQVQDQDDNIVDSIRDLKVEIKDTKDLRKITLKLNVALNSQE